MDPFAPRPRANLDYWFWKFHVGDLALLIDVIIRRRTGLGEVRVSQWLRGVPRVIHGASTAWSATEREVRVGDTRLAPGRCVGGTGDVQWDLSWVAGDVVSSLPALLARLQPFDTTLVVWPTARFGGSVQVGSERFDLNDVAGTFYHYWGRRLADRWVWLSATDFESAPQRRVEGLIAAHTRLYGRVPFPLPGSWLWTMDGRAQDAVVSGVSGIISARVTATGVEVSSRSLAGRKHRLVASWGTIQPIDIGEGIVQTMHADLVLDGEKAAPSSVGLEVRGYPHPRVANEGA
jgi:hypothetical protein